MSSLAYVSLAEAKRSLRVDHSFEDTHISLLIEAASGAVKNYLNDFSAYEGERNSDDDYHYDSNHEPIIDMDVGSSGMKAVKPEVKVAVLLLVGEWYMNREGKGGNEGNYLPPAVVSILYPLRAPTSK